MKTSFHNHARHAAALTVAAAVALTLAGCAAAPARPSGAAEVRAKLTRLQSDTELSNRAPVALQEAESAVLVAEMPLDARESSLGAHRVYVADRKVEIAMAQAATAEAEARRVKLGEERERSRLDARTREADAAHADADATRIAAAGAATQAAIQAEDMQRQIAALQAKVTERGIVLTLGDVLFSSGRADLKSGATSNLDRLVAFLNQYPGRSVAIEGHTDDVGSDDSNQGLSQRRAESVKSFLVQQGIDTARITATGKGERQPVADNQSEGGRQQNRRVEVIIDNPAPIMGST